LNGDTGCSDEEDDDDNEDDDDAVKPSTSKAAACENINSEEIDDVQFVPTKELMSIIDVKTEQLMSDDCVIVHGDEKKLEDSQIDITLSL
jgi:hypothetical protein